MKQLPHRIDQKSHAAVHHAGQRSAGDTWDQHAYPILLRYPAKVNNDDTTLFTE